MTLAAGRPLREAIAPATSGLDRRLAIALVFLAAFTAVILQTTLLDDPDTQWHIAVGEWIWRTASLPLVDTFSHTFAGAPWIAKEWLSQLVFFAGWSLAGWTGPVVVAALAAAGALALLFGFLERRLHPLAALLFVALVFALAQSQLLARPHIFVFPLAALWTIGLVSAAEEGRRPPLLLLAVLVLWVNLHATFPIALAIAAALGAEALLVAAPAERKATVLRWGLFGLLALACTIVTPYGIRPLAIMLELSNGGEAVPFITEWQPVRWEMRTMLAAALLVVALASFALVPMRSLFRFLLVAILAYLALSHSRFLGFAGLVTVILLAGPLAMGLGRSLAAARPRALRHVPRPLLAAGLALSVFAAGLATATRHPVPNPTIAPEAAFAEAERLGLKSYPVFNSYDFGGFLILGGVKTFIDGRTDQLFLGGFMTRFMTLAEDEAHQPFLDFVSAHGARWALVQTDSGAARHFAAASGWSKVYEDTVATVFAETAILGSRERR